MMILIECIASCNNNYYLLSLKLYNISKTQIQKLVLSIGIERMCAKAKIIILFKFKLKLFD